jgi:hypothetical protein
MAKTSTKEHERPKHPALARLWKERGASAFWRDRDGCEAVLLGNTVHAAHPDSGEVHHRELGPEEDLGAVARDLLERSGLTHAGEVQREMTPEEYQGTPDDPNWESKLNEVAAAEAVRRVEELAKPLQDDESVNAADYFELAERLIGGIDVDAIVPTKPVEKRAVEAVWILREYVNDPHGWDPTDFVDVAVRVLHDTEFLPPANDEQKISAPAYHCWVVTQRRPRRVRTWSCTRKADAIRGVREAVKEHRTEGGVTCDDPKKPLAIQFVWKRGGKIEASEF